MTRMLIGLFLVFVSSFFVGGVSADDPYDAWGHGRPKDAILPLHEKAEASQRWDAWLDVGLAAAAANRQGEAVAWILKAHLLAPDQPEPRQALKALGVAIPGGWIERLGPLAIPGTGWIGIILITLGAAGFGYGLCTTRFRTWTLIGSGTLLMIALPGRLALDHDQARELVSAVQNTLLYDSAGTPVTEINIGTVMQRDQAEIWAERMLVLLGDGKKGFVPVIDTIAKP